METALEILKLAAVGLIAGLFSAAIANRNHRHLKWWEMRVKAYQDAIEALSDLVHVYETNYNAEIAHRELPEDFEKRLTAYSREAYPKIRKLTDCGSFLFSDIANEALKDFMKDDYADMYVEHLEQNLTKAQKCLNLLVKSSKTDLSLNSQWLTKWI